MMLLDAEPQTDPSKTPFPDVSGCTSSVQVHAYGYGDAYLSSPPSPVEEISLANICSGDTRLVLWREVRATLRQEEDVWCCELDELDVVGYGDDEREAVQDFMDDFAAAYNGLVGLSDSQLTLDAQEMRDELARRVARVARGQEDPARSRQHFVTPQSRDAELTFDICPADAVIAL